MSLKAFHIVFVIASVLLALGFGLWALIESAQPDRGAGMIVMGVAALVVAAGMIVYGVWFLRKLKNVSYL
jgi:hypothetical protein